MQYLHRLTIPQALKYNIHHDTCKTSYNIMLYHCCLQLHSFQILSYSTEIHTTNSDVFLHYIAVTHNISQSSYVYTCICILYIHNHESYKCLASFFILIRTHSCIHIYSYQTRCIIILFHFHPLSHNAYTICTVIATLYHSCTHSHVIHLHTHSHVYISSHIHSHSRVTIHLCMQLQLQLYTHIFLYYLYYLAFTFTCILMYI